MFELRDYHLILHPTSGPPLLDLHLLWLDIIRVNSGGGVMAGSLQC